MPLVFSLWWLYFSREDSDLLLDRKVAANMVWGFGHYFVFASAAAVGAGLAARVDHYTHHSESSDRLTALAVTLPTAVLVASIYVFHLSQHDRSGRTIGAFLACVVVIFAGTFTVVPELVAGLACTALVAVTVVDPRNRPTATSWRGTERAVTSQQPEIVRFLRAAFLERVPRDHRQSDADFRRRRIVAAITIVVGATLLGLSLRLAPGDNRFYVYTLALAACWVVGSLASGPIHLGRAQTRAGDHYTRPVAQPLVVGLAAVAVFAVGAVVIAQIGPMRDSVNDVLDHARFASLPVVAAITLVNGISEELFFRGALFAAIGRRYPVVISTLAYTLVTVAAGNAMLVAAAAALGTIVGLQRAVTGGVLAPIITHVTWSMSMLFLLPPLISAVS